MDKRQVLAIALLASAVGSWVYILGPTMNYMNYYAALSQLSLDVNSVSEQAFQSNITLSFNFNITNLTPYVGLTFEYLSYTGTLQNQTGRPVTVATGGAALGSFVPLKPNVPVLVQSTYVLTGLGMTQFQALCQQWNSTLSWDIAGVMTIGTRDGALVPTYDRGASSQC